MNIAIGTYTTVQPHVPGACGKGIEILTMNPENGGLTPRSSFSAITDPTYLSWDKGTGTLYSITEDPESDGMISCFTVSSEVELKLEGSIKGPGPAGCHLSCYPDIKRIYSAAYLGGRIEGCRTENSIPVEITCVHSYTGSGPNSDRQEASHAHMLARSLKHSSLFVCDLGCDTIWKHRLNGAGDAGAAVAALKLPGGYGPRHMALSEDEKTAYILCELIPRLITAEINEAGEMKILSDKATVMQPEGSPSNPAAVRIHPCGRSIAVSNRFQDTIGIFRIENSGGVPEPVLVEEFSCRGKTPRDINFTPDGGWLLIANQDSNNIETRRFDPGSGMPMEQWGPGLQTGSPVCITFLN